MPGFVCVLFDKNEEYVSRFLGYVKKKRNLFFELVAFTEGKLMNEFLQREKVDLLLLGEYELMAYVSGTGTGFETVVLEGDEFNQEGYIHVDKYRSMESIISDISEILKNRKADEQSGSVSIKVKTEIFGIYSFGYAQKAEKFALRLIENGGQKRALYINLTRFSNLKERIATAGEGSLSDIIYYYCTGSEKIRSAIKEAIGHIGFCDVILSPRDMEDIDEIDNWPDFLQTLAEYIEAELIVLDMDEAFRNLGEAFGMCERVYLLYDREKDKCRSNELKAYLRRLQNRGFTNQIMEVDVNKI